MLSAPEKSIFPLHMQQWLYWWWIYMWRYVRNFISIYFWFIIWSFYLNILPLLIFSFILFSFLICLVSLIDIDECENNSYPCDSNAQCINTIGSFNCTCRTGYIGDGFSCYGLSLLFYSSLSLFMQSSFFFFTLCHTLIISQIYVLLVRWMRSVRTKMESFTALVHWATMVMAIIAQVIFSSFWFILFSPFILVFFIYFILFHF